MAKKNNWFANCNDTDTLYTEYRALMVANHGDDRSLDEIAMAYIAKFALLQNKPVTTTKKAKKADKATSAPKKAKKADKATSAPKKATPKKAEKADKPKAAAKAETPKKDDKPKRATTKKAKKADKYGDLPTGFKTILKKLDKFDGIEVEVLGTWIWVSGNTKAIKDELKAMGFSFAGRKKMWFYSANPKTGKRHQPMSAIRARYGKTA